MLLCTSIQPSPFAKIYSLVSIFKMKILKSLCIHPIAFFVYISLSWKNQLCKYSRPICMVETSVVLVNRTVHYACTTVQFNFGKDSWEFYLARGRYTLIL